MAEKRITDVDYIESLNSNESFFVNHNNAIKQINKSNIVFDISNGGTNANNATDARANLGAAAEVHKHDASDITSGTIAKERLPALTASDVGALSSDDGGTINGALNVKGSATITGTIVANSGMTTTGTIIMNGGDIILKEGVNYSTDGQLPVACVKGRLFLKKVKSSS